MAKQELVEVLVHDFRQTVLEYHPEAGPQARVSPEATHLHQQLLPSSWMSWLILCHGHRVREDVGRQQLQVHDTGDLARLHAFVFLTSPSGFAEMAQVPLTSATLGRWER